MKFTRPACSINSNISNRQQCHALDTIMLSCVTTLRHFCDLVNKDL